MRVSRIIKHKEGHRLLCKLTVEDIDLIPKQLTAAELMKVEFPIENMASSKGFWFRLCFERHWDGRAGYLVEPPKVEGGVASGE